MPSYVYVGNYDSNGRPLLVNTNLFNDAIVYDEGPSVIAQQSIWSPGTQEKNDNFDLPDNKKLIDINTLSSINPVAVTFMSSQTSNQNAFGFFTYPTGTTLTSTSDVHTHYILFPNMKALQVGDTMICPYAHTTKTVGNQVFTDKIYSTRFPRGRSFGFFVVRNGWTGNSVSKTAKVYYSLPSLNTETDPTLQIHALLHDISYRPDSSMIMFEDTTRTPGLHTDNDFNDAIVAVWRTKE